MVCESFDYYNLFDVVKWVGRIVSVIQKQKTLLYVIPASFSFTLSKEGLRNMMNFWWFLMRSSGTGVTWKVGIRLNIDNGSVYLFYLPVNCIITKNNMVNSTGYRRSQKQVKRSRDSDKVSYKQTFSMLYNNPLNVRGGGVL